MKAIVQTKYGSPGVLELLEVERSAGPGRTDARQGSGGIPARAPGTRRRDRLSVSV